MNVTTTMNTAIAISRFRLNSSIGASISAVSASANTDHSRPSMSSGTEVEITSRPR